MPPELADAICSLDSEDKILPTHEGTDKTFRFCSEDDEKYFRNKRVQDLRSQLEFCRNCCFHQGTYSIILHLVSGHVA